MNNEDYILKQINTVIKESAKSTTTLEFGNFKSREDRAYRKQAVNDLFCALTRENQNLAITYLIGAVQEQYS